MDLQNNVKIQEAIKLTAFPIISFEIETSKIFVRNK